MDIKRDFYLTKLINRMGNGQVKVIPITATRIIAISKIIFFRNFITYYPFFHSKVYPYGKCYLQ